MVRREPSRMSGPMKSRATSHAIQGRPQEPGTQPERDSPWESCCRTRKVWSAARHGLPRLGQGAHSDSPCQCTHTVHQLPSLQMNDVAQHCTCRLRGAGWGISRLCARHTTPHLALESQSRSENNPQQTGECRCCCPSPHVTPFGRARQHAQRPSLGASGRGPNCTPHCNGTKQVLHATCRQERKVNTRKSMPGSRAGCQQTMYPADHATTN